jgi:hypothetical protein
VFDARLQLSPTGPAGLSSIFQHHRAAGPPSLASINADPTRQRGSESLAAVPYPGSSLAHASRWYEHDRRGPRFSPSRVIRCDSPGVFSTRGRTPHGGPAGIEVRAEMCRRGVSAMANQGNGDLKGDGVDRRGLLRRWGGRGRELQGSARKAQPRPGPPHLNNSDVFFDSSSLGTTPSMR